MKEGRKDGLTHEVAGDANLHFLQTATSGFSGGLRRGYQSSSMQNTRTPIFTLMAASPWYHTQYHKMSGSFSCGADEMDMHTGGRN